MSENRFKTGQVCVRNTSEWCFLEQCPEWQADRTCRLSGEAPPTKEWRTIPASDLGNQQVVRFVGGKPARLKKFKRPPRRFPALWMREVSKAQEQAEQRKMELKGGAA